MIKVTEKLVSDIIDKYLMCFPHKEKPDYIIVSKKHKFNDGKATMLGPVDGEYGLSVNIKDYEFENIETLTAVVLHEMVHFNLLLDEKQTREKFLFSHIDSILVNWEEKQFLIWESWEISCRIILVYLNRETCRTFNDRFWDFQSQKNIEIYLNFI